MADYGEQVRRSTPNLHIPVTLDEAFFGGALQNQLAFYHHAAV
jgi:hypothetical protein